MAAIDSHSLPPSYAANSPCSQGVKWLKDHPYISLAFYFIAAGAATVFLYYVDWSLSHRLIVGAITASVLTITFVPFGCLCNIKRANPHIQVRRSSLPSLTRSVSPSPSQSPSHIAATDRLNEIRKRQRTI